jgi:hypothetical protein
VSGSWFQSFQSMVGTVILGPKVRQRIMVAEEAVHLMAGGGGDREEGRGGGRKRKEERKKKT